MKKLELRIQRNNNLNDVYVDDIAGPGNGRHKYVIVRAGTELDDVEAIADYELLAKIKYQQGPRAESDSETGVTDQDLLEIVRHRLQCFQQGDYATRENACALTHIEEALMWMAKRADDRAERGVLGTMEK